MIKQQSLKLPPSVPKRYQHIVNIEDFGGAIDMITEKNVHLVPLSESGEEEG